MNPHHFHRFIIRPSLQWLDPEIKRSVSAEILLLGTALHESGDLEYWKQGLRTLADGDGVARGPYGIEPPTHRDIRLSVLAFNRKLDRKVMDLAGKSPSLDEQLITNPCYATAIARVQYWRWPDPMPDDIRGMAAFHEKRFNTEQGAIGRTLHVLEALPCFERARAIVEANDAS